jgi:DNA-binding transcriptional ArsR family regulator
MEQLTDISPVELAAVAAALSDSGRAAILISLLDGRARTANELAFVAGVTPQTASAHLGHPAASSRTTTSPA